MFGPGSSRPSHFRPCFEEHCGPKLSSRLPSKGTIETLEFFFKIQTLISRNCKENINIFSKETMESVVLVKEKGKV